MKKSCKRKITKALCLGVGSLLSLLKRRAAKKTAAVILSGGTGSRFGADVPKQLVEVLGIPILVRSALAFDACRDICEIVIVARKEDIAATEALCREYRIKKPFRVTAGGQTRQASALNGAMAVSEGIGYLAIHDAARCLVTPETVSGVVKAAYHYRAASAACPIHDTVKLVDGQGFIRETVDREHLMAAQTPQVFERRLYLAAAYTAKEKGISVTDDNALMESVGQAVKLVSGETENFKITTRADLLHAEAVLRERSKTGDER